MNKLLHIGNVALKSKLNTEHYTICIDDLANWRATWLTSPFQSNIWELKGLKTPINFYGVFKNGESLLEPKYSSLLNTIKKIVFLKRSGHLADLKGKQATRSTTQYALSRSLISFAQYLVNNNHYEIGKGFSSLTKGIFNKLVGTYVDGGRDAVCGHFDIVESALRKLQFKGKLEEVIDDQNILLLDKFSSTTGCDRELVKGLGSLSRYKLNKYCLLTAPTNGLTLYGNKIEFNNATPLKGTRETNKNSEDSPSKVSDTSIDLLVSTANVIGDFKIPLQYAELAFFEPFEASASDYAENSYTSRRTPTIPNEIALAYIDSAVEFVHTHGDNIVSALSKCMKQIAKEVDRRSKPRKDHVCKHIVVPRNSTTEHFGVHRFNKLSVRSSIKEVRESVTLELLVEIYQSAVFILLATFPCKRYQDVIAVRQVANTISFFGVNSIKFGLAKADPVEVLRAVGRPVPRVVANAFDNLVEINKLLLSESEPDTSSNYLFQKQLSLPSNLELVDNQCITRDLLIRRNIQFADFVEIPTVELYGIESRWYLNRMHMLRRFFACAYYGVNGTTGFSALTWLMGHKDAKETMHYVTENMGNAEMTECDAADVLASAISESVDGVDIVKNLSDLIGKSTMDFRLAKNKTRLKRRVQELFDDGYKVIRDHSGDLVFLASHDDD